MADAWLPSSRHAKDLIEQADEHLNKSTEKDLKFALIHADNAIESLLKEHARYGKNKRINDVVEMSFHKLLEECGDLPAVLDGGGDADRFCRRFCYLENLVKS